MAAALALAQCSLALIVETTSEATTEGLWTTSCENHPPEDGDIQLVGDSLVQRTAYWVPLMICSFREIARGSGGGRVYMFRTKASYRAKLVLDDVSVIAQVAHRQSDMASSTLSRHA